MLSGRSRRGCFLALLMAGSLAACSSDESASPSEGGSVKFTISGEALALGGYPFPATSSDDIVFVDGWQVEFERVLVTIGSVNLLESPDKSPTDQAETDAVVAELRGPWVIDLHQGGPLPGKGGSDEKAYPIATLSTQNRNGDKPFAADRRYAFGFSVVAATATAQRLNLDEAGEADYQEMIERGYTAFFSGTATFKGADCSPKNNPVLDAIPKVVRFRFGLSAPSTYLNCQNPDNDPAEPFAGEEHQRGIAIRSNTESIAQLTLHTDHLFWEATEHDSPAHFDQFAVFARPGDDGVARVTLEDLTGVDVKAFRTKDNQPLVWRSCVPPGDYPLPTRNPMGFDAKSVPVDPAATPDTALRDLYDYVIYNASTMGHLNADGLCSVKREYPSPP